MAGPWRPARGDVVYLTPTTKTAPAAAYQHRQGVVVHVAGPDVTVDLGDGTRLTTHERNVWARCPTPPARTAAASRRRDGIDPRHGVETTIFDFLTDPPP
jgi:hypothetical protein